MRFLKKKKETKDTERLRVEQEVSKGPFEGRQRLTLGNSGRKMVETRVKGVGAVSVDRDALRGWGP